jgi:flagellar hook-associated protein 2
VAGESYISGIISNLRTDEILDQLLQLSRVPVQRLEDRKSALETQLTAWQTVNTRLLAVKTALTQFVTGIAVDSYTATSSHESVVGVTASSSASPGVYAFTVSQLAANHQVASQGYADADTTSLGTGTVTISVGGGASAEIAVDGLTLYGLRDAINNAGVGARAVVVNTGADTNPYQLLISSTTSGTAGAMNIAVDLTGGTAPTFTEVQAAQDASLTFGSGAGAVTVTRSSNTITDVIPGVTLRLLATQTASPVSITVTRDVDSIRAKIDEFVTAYNDLVAFINEQFDYDADTGETGTLFGEYRLSQLHNQLASIISNPIDGIASGWSLLSQIGIRLGADGALTVDSSELDAALADDPDAVRRLFARYGTATNSAVSYVAATADTEPSGAAGYAIEVTQVATRSRLTAGVAQTEVLAADETLTIDGVAVTLTAGMTQAEVIAAINAHSAETSVVASATDQNGEGSGSYLTLTQARYGSGPSVTAVSTLSNGGAQNTSGIGTTEVSDESPAGESGGTGASGLDIAGTINGEAADGSGQVLVSTAGDSTGLRVLVQASSVGSYGSVVYTAGVAGQLDALLAFVTEDAGGAIKAAQDTIQGRIEGIDDQIDHLEDSIAAEQERIRKSFEAMEVALGRLQTQSSYLEQYLAQIRANSAAS